MLLDDINKVYANERSLLITDPPFPCKKSASVSSRRCGNDSEHCRHGILGADNAFDIPSDGFVA